MPITVDKLGSPIIVTGTTDTDSEVVPREEKAYVKSIYWYGPTSGGHLLVLTDGEGREIIKMYAAEKFELFRDFITLQRIRLNQLYAEREEIDKQFIQFLDEATGKIKEIEKEVVLLSINKNK